MRRLPDRVYLGDAALRRQLCTPQSVLHPAKMRLTLLLDLLLRYTQPGQTILDPFGGVGSTLIAAVLPVVRRAEPPRHVLLHELEPRFVELARGNWAKLQGLAAQDARRLWIDLETGETQYGWQPGHVTILQGDSRHLPLAGAERESSLAAAIGSPPSGGSEAVDDRGRRGVNTVHGGGNAHGARDGHDAAADCVITSPPYAMVASRDRSAEPHAQAQDPLLRARYGSGDCNRHIDGYADHTPGQIGDLAYGGPAPAVALGSPPYQGSIQEPDGLDWFTRQIEQGSASAAVRQRFAGWKRDAERAGAGVCGGDYGHSTGQLADQTTDDYRAACTAVYAEVRRVIPPGGLLVLVTGDFVRDGCIVPLGDDTVAMAQSAGWTPLERWRARKAQLSFWRRLYAQQAAERGEDPAAVTVTHEDVLVFCAGTSPAWPFRALPPQRGQAGVRLPSAGAAQRVRPRQAALGSAGGWTARLSAPRLVGASALAEVASP